MARTYLQLVSDVMRETNGQATYFEAQQAVADSLDMFDAMGRWEFLIFQANIKTYAPYSTGTVSCVAGTNAVTLVGGTFPWVGGGPGGTGGSYPEIKFSSRRMPYKVSTINNGTSLTLVDTISGTVGGALPSITNDSYVLYRARYPLPYDCAPGQDLVIRGPIGQGIDLTGKVKKLPRMMFEWKRYDITTASVVQWYTDDEYDEKNSTAPNTSGGTATIRFEPYPRIDGEFRLIYYKKITIPTTDVGYAALIPQSFEYAIVLAASSQVMARKGMKGWMEKKQAANDLLNKLWARHGCSASYEGEQEPDLQVNQDIAYGQDSVLYTLE
jgi:hypothetical protein